MTLGLIPHFSSTSALRYFFEVARYGSFRLAAEKVRIAASAISRQIQLLEDELGVKLFERDRQGLRLTVAGETLLHRVRRAMSELTLARSELSALKGGQFGRVVLGVNDTVAREFVIDFLARFRQDYPGIDFGITVASTGDLVALLLNNEVDIMVGYAVPARDDLEQVTSFELETCLMVHREHPLAQRSSVRVSDLVDETFIMPDPALSLRRVLDAVFTRASIRPTSSIATNSYEVMADLVAGGFGVGVQLRLTAAMDKDRPEIAYVPMRDPEIRPFSLSCCVRSSLVPSAAVLLCTKHLRDALNSWLMSHKAAVIAA